jgi:subtilisin family serine protease
VRIAVVDTGLLNPDDRGPAPWLDGVTGEPDDLVRRSPTGVRRIDRYAGHGTFAAGVARCMAPDAEVRVTDHFSASGAELESEMISKMEELFTGPDPAPDIINLSAGTYTRNDWANLGFDTFAERHPEVLLIAAAGNDATRRPLYPAAFPWAVSVGALGPDQRHRAWFSNYGPSVDVYAAGEGLVNVFARGEYTYREPPRRPAVQHFDGMARWDGTSFSAPLVAGLVAVEAARTGVSARDAVTALLAEAATVHGLGPVLTV